MKVARLSLIAACVVLQSACLLIGTLSRANESVSNSNSRARKPAKAPNSGREYKAYLNEVKKQWANSNYQWLDGEAKKLRVSKERLPGGYWKLRTLYRGVEEISDEESDEVWTEHIRRLEDWTKQQPASVMARIALAEVWRTFAWKARGTGYAHEVERELAAFQGTS